MTTIAMPEPVTYAHFTEDGLIRMWSRNPDHLQAVTEAIGKQPTALITTTQAEAYADARVREALEEAAQLCDAQHFGGDNDDDLGWTSCAANLAHDIRALIPPTKNEAKE